MTKPQGHSSLRNLYKNQYDNSLSNDILVVFLSLSTFRFDDKNHSVLRLLLH